MKKRHEQPREEREKRDELLRASALNASFNFRAIILRYKKKVAVGNSILLQAFLASILIELRLFVPNLASNQSDSSLILIKYISMIETVNSNVISSVF